MNEHNETLKILYDALVKNPSSTNLERVKEIINRYEERAKA